MIMIDDEDQDFVQESLTDLKLQHRSALQATRAIQSNLPKFLLRGKMILGGSNQGGL